MRAPSLLSQSLSQSPSVTVSVSGLNCSCKVLDSSAHTVDDGLCSISRLGFFARQWECACERDCMMGPLLVEITAVMLYPDDVCALITIRMVALMMMMIQGLVFSRL